MTDVQKSEPAKTPAPAPTVFDPFEWRPFDMFRRFGSLVDWPTRKSLPEFEAFERLLGGWPSQPAVDLAEKDREYEITAELPGLDEKDVEVRLANGLLTISGEKKAEREEKEKDYHFSERRYGSFRRTFRVPESVDPERIEASFDKGVLMVRLPKSAQAAESGKKIEIKSK
jgi:HSP20 family protein